MGCGASAQNTVVEEAPAPEAKPNKVKAAQLKKINSKLGSRTIENSFVVQKSRSRRRTSDTGDTHEGDQRKNAVDRESLPHVHEEPLNADPFHLPAEAAAVAEPGFQGVSASGPSFKMARGSQMRVLSDVSKLHDVEIYKPKLYKNHDNEILEGVTYFREQLSVVNPPVAAIRQTGILPRLIALLRRDDNRKLQYEVAWTLTNICSAEHEDCQDVVDQGAVPEFIRMLGACDDVEVLEQAIWALGNIAADSKELQKQVLEERVLPPLLGAMNRHQDKASLLRHSAWLLSNLCRPKPQTDDLFTAIPTLSAVLKASDDAEVVTHACWALAYLTGVEEALDELAAASKLLPAVLSRLVSWVHAATHSATTPALRVLGNFCSSNSAHTQAVVDAGGVQAMLSCLLNCNRVSLMKEVIWSLSNIAAGTTEQVAALLSAGVFPKIIGLMSGSEEAIKRECTYVLANPWASTVSVSHEVAKGLLDAGLVAELTKLLEVATPLSILIVAMDGLQDAIKRGQAMRMAIAKTLPPRAEGEPEREPVGNPVAEIMKQHGIMERLRALMAHGDAAIPSKANGMLNILQFL